MIRLLPLPLLLMSGWVLAADGARPAADPIGPGSLFQVVVALALVLAFIGASAWLLRRFGRFSVNGTRALRVVASLPLSTRERVVLLQVGEKQLLLGVSPGRVQTLHVLETPLDVSEGGEGATFAERLQNAMHRGHPR